MLQKFNLKNNFLKKIYKRNNIYISFGDGIVCLYDFFYQSLNRKF